MGAYKMPQSKESTSEIDSQGRKTYDLHNMTKKLLVDIGFTDIQYTDFKDDCEQLCGAKYPSDAKCTTAKQKQDIIKLAKEHVFDKWDSIVRRGVRDDQHERFWRSWLTTCLRSYTQKANTKKWVQTKFQDLTQQSTRGESSAASLEISHNSIPRSTKEDSTPLTTDTRLGGGLSQSLTIPFRPSRSPSIKPEWLSQGSSRARKWRDVRVRVSFKQMVLSTNQPIRKLDVPLIRCVYEDYIDTKEDDEVTASWLNFDSLVSLVVEHIGIDIDEHTICATAKKPSPPLRLYSSNDLHQAYNKWVCTNDRTVNDIWLMLVPNHQLDSDVESDVPDDLNPFRSGEITKPITPELKKPLGNASDKITESKHDKAIIDKNSEHKTVSNGEGSEPDTARDAEKFEHDIASNHAKSKKDTASQHTGSIQDDEDRDDIGLQSQPDDPYVEGDENRRVKRVRLDQIENIPNIDHHGGKTNLSIDGIHPAPDIQYTGDDEDNIEDGDALGAGQSYQRTSNPTEFKRYRPGDEEHYTMWTTKEEVLRPKPDVYNTGEEDDAVPTRDYSGSKYDYIRPNHRRPDRFNDKTWLKAAGFNETNDELENATEDDDGFEAANKLLTSEEDLLEQRLAVISDEVLRTKALEQFHPEMWATIAQFLMCRENQRFKASYQFHIPGAKPDCARTPAQMFASVWMKLNEIKVKGGVMADQVGSGKTRTTLASTVADRAYINRMWQDWNEDKEKAKQIPGYERRHLPEWDEQLENQRCPSASKWLFQCVCESWGVTRHFEEQRGPTIVFGNANTLKPIIDEFIKMFSTDPSRSKGGYRNKGFGKKDGFGYDDKQPFRLIIGHEKTLQSYKQSDGYDFRIRPTDPEFLAATDDSEYENTLIPQVFTDRVVILTTTESYVSCVADKLTVYDDIEQHEQPKTRGKRSRPDRKPRPEKLRFGVVIIDEAHLHKSTPSALNSVTKRLKVDKEDWFTTIPNFWCMTGTPFAVDIFKDVGGVYGKVWEQLARYDLKVTDWRKSSSWMAGFDEASITTMIKDNQKILSRSKITSQAFSEVQQFRKQYVRDAVRFASRLIIQRTEHTIIQGRSTTKLPPVQRITQPTPLKDDEQMKLANDPWLSVKATAEKEYCKAYKKWQSNGSKGTRPNIDSFLQASAKSLPLVRAATSFPQLVTVAERWRESQVAKFERENTFFDDIDRDWKSLSDDEKFQRSALRLTVTEFSTQRWDRLETEQQGPYFTHMEEIMDNCHKKPVLDQFWDQIGNSTNAEGRFDKGIVFTCSPAASMVVYLYYKYGCNSTSSKYHRHVRSMNVLLITSTNWSKPDINRHIARFNEEPSAIQDEKYKGVPTADIIVCTTGTFGTGQNCGRARYALVLEPQPDLARSIQCAGRIRRSGFTEMVYVWDAMCPESTWEEIQRLRNHDHSALLDQIQKYEREAMAEHNTGSKGQDRREEEDIDMQD